MEEIKTKVCIKCGKELPIDAFNKKASSKDGLQTHCRECHSAYMRERYIANKNNKQKMLPVFTNPELAKLQPRELLAELKSRGYEWEKMYAPRQEVLYSKV